MFLHICMETDDVHGVICEMCTVLIHLSICKRFRLAPSSSHMEQQTKNMLVADEYLMCISLKTPDTSTSSAAVCPAFIWWAMGQCLATWEVSVLALCQTNLHKSLADSYLAAQGLGHL